MENNSIQETMKEVESEINAEEQESQQSKSQQDSNVQTAQQTQQQAEQKNIDQKLSELDKDEEFQKSVPKNFSQSKEWRRLYWQRKEAERQTKELQEKLSSYESNNDDSGQDQEQTEVSDNDLIKLAQERGYTLTKQEKKQLEQLEELEQMLSRIENPQEKQWWNNYAQAISNNLLKKLSPILNDFAQMNTDYNLSKSYEMAKKHIEKINKDHGLNLDYDKDIDPEIIKMLKENPRLMDKNIFDLTQLYLANHGIALGKKLSEKQSRELNEQKKKINVETNLSSSNSIGNTEDNKTLREILQEERQKQGVTGFI